MQILERESGWDSRPQGYHIGLRQSGCAALDAIGLREKIAAVVEPQAQTVFHTLTARGQVLGSSIYPAPDISAPIDASQKDTHGAVLIQRRLLREVLLAGALEAGATIRWDTDFETVCCASHPGHASTVSDAAALGVRLMNGEHLPADLVIGADGMRSKLRDQLHTAPLVDLGYRRLGGRVLTTARGDAAKLLANLGSDKHLPDAPYSSWVVTGPGACLFVAVRPGCSPGTASSLGEPDITWGLSFQSGKYASAVRENLKTPESAIATLTDVLASLKADGWMDGVLTLLAHTDPDTMTVTHYMTRETFKRKLPHSFDDEIFKQAKDESCWCECGCDDSLNRRVTFIGDAAHPMTPFAGRCTCARVCV